MVSLGLRTEHLKLRISIPSLKYKNTNISAYLRHFWMYREACQRHLLRGEVILSSGES